MYIRPEFSIFLHMAINLNYEFLFIGRDENSFLENYVYDATDDFGDKGGKLWVSLEIQNNPAEAESIAEAVFETARKFFFTDVELDGYSRFELALKEMNKVLEEFKAAKTSHYIGNVNAVLAGVIGNEIYLSQCGEAEAYLVRKRYVSIITEGLSDESYEFFTNIATGILELNDLVLLSSSRLLRYISKTELAKYVVIEDAVKTLEEINGAVASEILGRVGLAAITVSEKVEVIEKEEEVQQRPSIIALKLDFLKNFKGLKNFPKLPKVNLQSLKLDKIDWKKFREKANSTYEKAKDLKERFIKPESGKDKILAAVGIVIVLLALVIGVTKWRQSSNAVIAELDLKLNRARDEVSEAVTKGQFDKAEAGVILAHAEQTAREVLNTDMRAKATEILSQIQETKDLLDNSKRISDSTVYVDLSKTKATINALGILQLKDRTYVYDNSSLFELVLDQVGTPLTIADNETVISGAVFGDRSSSIFLTKSGKVVEFKDGTFRYMTTLDGSFHKGVALKTWLNKLYILSPEEDQIWRYQYAKTSDKFGNAEAYKKDGSVKDTVDLAIDGNIYILAKNGSIQRYYAGKVQDTPLLKAPFRNLETASKIDTDEDMMQIFVLSSAENRIYIYQKEQAGAALSYNRQYQIDNIGELRDMYYDKTANQVYFIDTKKIYKLQL